MASPFATAQVGSAADVGGKGALLLSLSGPVELVETARLIWKRQGIAVQRQIQDPAGALALAGEMAGQADWCMLRLTDHPEWETAGYNRLDGITAAQVWRFEGLARALKTLAPQVIVVERTGPTLFELTRFGSDLWNSRTKRSAGTQGSGKGDGK